MGNEVEKLFEQLEHRDSVQRGRAAEALGEIGGPGVADAIGRLLEDDDVVVRFKAAVVLAYLRDDRGLETLLWALGRSELCFSALQALTEIGSPQALPQIRKFFRRVFLHNLERMQAAAALHTSGDRTGTAFLEEKLDSSKPEERGFALELWGRLKMPGAYELLLGVLDNPEDTHRLDALRGLAFLGDQKCISALERMARQPEDTELAALAAETLEMFSGE